MWKMEKMEKTANNRRKATAVGLVLVGLIVLWSFNNVVLADQVSYVTAIIASIQSI